MCQTVNLSPIQDFLDSYHTPEEVAGLLNKIAFDYIRAVLALEFTQDGA